MVDLHFYSTEIEKILKQMDSFSPQRLFDLYTSLPDSSSKEGFVLAMIGQLIMLETKLKNMCSLKN
jgi:hypothetical protein